MAMACLRLLTRPPLPPFPLRSVPCFRLRIALATSRLELRLYLRRLVRRAMSIPPGLVRVTFRRSMCKQATCREKTLRVPADNHRDRRARLSDASRADPVRRAWPRASLRAGALRSKYSHVVELELSPRVAEEGAATAHVPAPHELRRKVEPQAEDFLEREDVLPVAMLTGAGELPDRSSVSSIAIPAARPPRCALEAPALRRRRACPCGDRGRTDGASVHLPSTR